MLVNLNDVLLPAKKGKYANTIKSTFGTPIVPVSQRNQFSDADVQKLVEMVVAEIMSSR